MWFLDSVSYFYSSQIILCLIFSLLECFIGAVNVFECQVTLKTFPHEIFHVWNTAFTLSYIRPVREPYYAINGAHFCSPALLVLKYIIAEPALDCYKSGHEQSNYKKRGGGRRLQEWLNGSQSSLFNIIYVFLQAVSEVKDIWAELAVQAHLFTSLSMC